MVIDYLKIYTFIERGNRRTRKKHKEHPELREAHKALAREIITFLHGKEEFERAVSLADHLFHNKFQDLSKKDIEDLFSSEEIKEVESNTNIVDMILQMEIAGSKREAREFITNGAISINGEKVNDINSIIVDTYFIENTYIVIKKGKKNYYIGKRK
ncbi:MAG: S4 domain-containing protein [Clostridia bacterium]